MCLMMSDCLRTLRCTLSIYDLVDEITVHTPLTQLLAALRGIVSLERADFHFFLPQADDTAEEYLRYSGTLFALLDRFLSAFLADCRTLKELRLRDVPYTATLFKCIACLPHLQEFDWKLQPAPDTLRPLRRAVPLSHLELEIPSPFPSLRSWYLNLNLDAVNDAYPTEGFLAAFLDSTTHSPIRSIVLSWIASKEWVYDIVEIIARTWPMLRDLTLAVHPPLDHGLVHVHLPPGDDVRTSWGRWTLHTFRPLLKCANLEIVNLHVHENYSFAFTDKELSQMKAWPLLRSLRVVQASDACECQRPQVTVMGLIALLLACPSLQDVTLEIDLNPAVHPNLLQVWTTTLVNSQLRQLRIGNASIRKPEQIASLLFAIAPNMASLEFGPMRLPEINTFQTGSDEVVTNNIVGMEAELERIKNAQAVNRFLRKLRASQRRNGGK
ncbi:hypothetical protein CALVIDRAFT_86822 [Calocera viscosa TUFC12733]|uniref:F-box domain-containing protein n=1 Tax=Calocera viscosa (strain TUFC12733) TaxID=1330018 RepID=A0A167N5I7_CALVF|nr:hypothetical protein CALVIDRAFT_86822 [Calocera viscosa TUFC12733]